MIIKSQRFGELEVPENKIITMVKPVLGFEHLKQFCLIELEEMRPFVCLQAIEDPATTFIVVNPMIFCADYKIEVNPKEIADLEITNLEAIETYVVATIPDNPAEVSINLQGPILINTENRLGRQLVLVNSKYNVTHRLLDEDTVMATNEEHELATV